MNWMKITGDAAMLGIETQQVMHLRMMKLFAGGPKAHSEAMRMVTEKTNALAEATMTLARGGRRRGLFDDTEPTLNRTSDVCRNREPVIPA